jgi:hypothetical protein
MLIKYRKFRIEERKIMTTYIVKEDGKNGTVEIFDDRVERIIKKLIGRDDEETIPIRAITGVKIDKKIIGAPSVILHAGPNRFEWKVKDGEAMVRELNAKLYPSA